MSTNKCGAQTCLLIEKADGPIVGGTAVRRDCGKQSIRGDHDPPFVLLQLGDRVWGWNPQDSNRNHHCCFSETHRQTNSQIQVVLVFRGECCLSTSSSLLCLSVAVSLIALGMKSLLSWPNCNEILGKLLVKTQHLHCNKHSEDCGSDLQSNHHVEAHFPLVTGILGIPLVKMLYVIWIICMKMFSVSWDYSEAL